MYWAVYNVSCLCARCIQEQTTGTTDPKMTMAHFVWYSMGYSSIFIFLTTYCYLEPSVHWMEIYTGLVQRWVTEI